MNSATAKKPGPILTRSGLMKLLTVWGLLVVTSAWVWADSQGSPRHYESGNHKVSLVELYTSEGCSSCPPADRWLSALKEGEALWENVVPLAFHVSYWDRLGWPDRFAQRTFDGRQRLLARRAGTGVYTPGVFRDGAEFRQWRSAGAKTIDRAFKAASERSPGAGNLELVSDNDADWLLRYQPAAGVPGDATHAFVAVLGNNLVNDIGRGENAGKKLEHNFVVLKLAEQELRATGSNSSKANGDTQNNLLHAEFNFDLLLPEVSPTALSIAAWVTDANGVPVQALGGPL